MTSSKSKSEQAELLNTSGNANIVSSPTTPGDNGTVEISDGRRAADPIGTVSGIPDGGWRAWLVCFASFWVNGTLFGIINSAGVFYVKLKDKYGSDEESSFRISLVGSLCVGTTFLLSPVASILTDRYGTRKTAFVGGVLVVIGMLLSSFVTSLEMLYLSYGVIVGAGASLTYTPSLVILGHYFQRRLGLVNGIVSAGSSLFTIVMPLLLEVMLNELHLSVTYQILSVLMATLLACALIFRPLLATAGGVVVVAKEANEETGVARKRSHRSRCANCCNRLINTDIWKNRTYMIWAIAFPTCLFGYFVPYGHLVKHVNDILPDYNGGVLITCIGAASGVGRIAAGQIADLPRVSRILLQQVSLICLGTFTMLLAASNEYWVLIAMCLGIGMFDGCFISLLAPIAFDIVGHKGASQAIGFLLGLCSIPLTMGPPIAGWMYDHMGQSYRIAFIAAGVPPIFGALLMFSIKCVKKPNPESDSIPNPEENALTVSASNEIKLSEVKSRAEDDNSIWQLRPEFQPSNEKSGLPNNSATNGELNNRHNNTSTPMSKSSINNMEHNMLVEKHSTC